MRQWGTEMTHLDYLGVSLFLDDEFALACGRHGGPGLVEDLLELLERAAASLDTEEEPEQRCAAIPHNEDKVVCAAIKILSIGDTQRRRGPQKYAKIRTFVSPALEPDGVGEGVDEARHVREDDMNRHALRAHLLVHDLRAVQRLERRVDETERDAEDEDHRDRRMRAMHVRIPLHPELGG